MNRTKIALLGCMILSQPLYAQDGFTYQQQIEKISHQLHEARKNLDYVQIEQQTKKLKKLLSEVSKDQRIIRNLDQNDGWTKTQMFAAGCAAGVCVVTLIAATWFFNFVGSIKGY